MAAPLAYRWARPSDAGAIAALAQSAYRGEASRAGWTTEADFLDGQRIDADGVCALLAPPSGVLLAEDATDASLRACCHLAADGEAAWFGLFAVDPKRQGQGIGDGLLAAAERRARDELGARRLRMKVIWLRDTLIAWYLRRGYARTDEVHPFPYGDPRFGLPRRDDLHFIVLDKVLAPD